MFSISKIVKAASFEALEETVTTKLAAVGFGILNTIDVEATLNKKLGSGLGRQYKILGACNPKFAKTMLEKESHLGVFLPCSVVIQEKGQDYEVAVMNVEDAFKKLQITEGTEIICQVQSLLDKFFESL